MLEKDKITFFFLSKYLNNNLRRAAYTPVDINSISDLNTQSFLSSIMHERNVYQHKTN